MLCLHSGLGERCRGGMRGGKLSCQKKQHTRARWVVVAMRMGLSTSENAMCGQS